MTETWKPCPGFEMHYQVSSLGRVRSHYWKTPKILKPVEDRYGYATVWLRSPTRAARVKIHRAVCEAFHGPCPDGHQCGHLDGHKPNNRADNLSWVTRSENTKHQIAHGTFRNPAKQGEDHPASKLSAVQVAELRTRHLGGESGRKLAREVGITSANMSKILRGERWKVVPQGCAQTQSSTPDNKDKQ